MFKKNAYSRKNSTPSKRALIIDCSEIKAARLIYNNARHAYLTYHLLTGDLRAESDTFAVWKRFYQQTQPKRMRTDKLEQ